MGTGFGFVVIALGASLLYKGYKGWSWSQFYGSIFGGSVPAAAAPANPGSSRSGQTSKNVKAG